MIVTLKQISVFGYHLRHIKNYITNPFKARILKYAEHMREMFEIDIYISTTINKGEKFDNTNFTAKKKFLDNTTRKTITVGITTAM